MHRDTKAAGCFLALIGGIAVTLSAIVVFVVMLIKEVSA